MTVGVISLGSSPKQDPRGTPKRGVPEVRSTSQALSYAQGWALAVAEVPWARDLVWVQRCSGQGTSVDMGQCRALGKDVIWCQ